VGAPPSRSFARPRKTAGSPLYTSAAIITQPSQISSPNSWITPIGGCSARTSLIAESRNT
jgi:hypothetical protein